jgi:transposase InsO family protein
MFIEGHKSIFEIRRMCSIFGVGEPAYYAWKKRPECKRRIENKDLLIKIKAIYEENHKVYGSPRITAALKANGEKCGKKRIARIMKENGITARTKKKFRFYTKTLKEEEAEKNILERNFAPDEPNKVWVSDITYIPTQSGWLFLCIIIDLYSRKVVGWSMSGKINTEIVIRAFEMAFLNRKPEKGLIFHSDRGLQYASKDFKEHLMAKGLIQSMSRKGNCWDNACAESFFHSLKSEKIYFYTFRSPVEARSVVFQYIELFYNRKRLHSFLGYKNPEEFEKNILLN